MLSDRCWYLLILDLLHRWIHRVYTGMLKAKVHWTRVQFCEKLSTIHNLAAITWSFLFDFIGLSCCAGTLVHSLHGRLSSLTWTTNYSYRLSLLFVFWHNFLCSVWGKKPKFVLASTIIIIVLGETIRANRYKQATSNFLLFWQKIRMKSDSWVQRIT